MRYTKWALKHGKKMWNCDVCHPNQTACCSSRSIVKFHEVLLTALQKIMLFAVLISQSTQHANYRKYITNLAWLNIDMKIEDWKL